MGWHFLLGDLPDLWIKPVSAMSPALQPGFFIHLFIRKGLTWSDLRGLLLSFPCDKHIFAFNNLKKNMIYMEFQKKYPLTRASEVRITYVQMMRLDVDINI